MQIQQIQSNSFSSKRRFIPQDMSENMHVLLKKMRSETRVVEKGDFQNITYIRGVRVENKGSIKDGKFLARRDENFDLIPFGENITMIETDKSRLIINNRTDEILEYKKPFFTTLKKAVNQASGLILEALNNYNNNLLVRKLVKVKETLTDSGKAKADEELKPILDFIERMSK